MQNTTINAISISKQKYFGMFLSENYCMALEDLEYSAVKWSSFTEPGSFNHPLSLRRKQRSLLKTSSEFLPKICFCVSRQKENNTDTWGSKRRTTSGTRVWEDAIVLHYGLCFTTILFGKNDFDTAHNLLKPTKGSGRSRGQGEDVWRRVGVKKTESEREKKKWGKRTLVLPQEASSHSSGPWLDLWAWPPTKPKQRPRGPVHEHRSA